MDRDFGRQLRQIPALSSLGDEQLAILQTRLHTKVFLSGEMVCAQGDTNSSLFIVVAGRLQVIRTDAAGISRVVGEIPSGELFGEMALITGQSRTASAKTIRDTILLELNEEDYCQLLSTHPQVARNITRMAIERLRDSGGGGSKETRCQTIAVIPASDSPLEIKFIEEFTRRMIDTGEVEIVTFATFHPGAPNSGTSDHSARNIGLIARLDRLERQQKPVIYAYDARNANWNQLCLRQADRLLVFFDAEASATHGGRGWHMTVDESIADLVVLSDSGRSSRVLLQGWAASRKWRAVHFIQSSHDAGWRSLCESLNENLSVPDWLKGSPCFSGFSDPDLRMLLAGMEIIDIAARDILFEQGTPSDGLFFVINGRLQAVIRTSTGQEKIAGAMGRGEVIGEMSLLTEEPRSATIRALRDSTVAKLPIATWKQMSESRPEWLTNLSRVVIDRLSGRRRLGTAGQSQCFAVQPLTTIPNLNDFLCHLEASFSLFGKCQMIDTASIEERFGPGSAGLKRGDPGEAVIVDWLHHQELSSDFLILICEETASEWTLRCLRQADQILLVAPADADPAPTKLETSLFDSAATLAQTPRQLVLLHPESATSGAGTIAWLTSRKVMSHYHVRHHNVEDVKRLVRLLTQRAYGLALSGGGSRGVAHIGVARALREVGVPIDVVYGTSAGAALAALIAMNTPIPSMIEKCTNMLTRSAGHLLSMGPPLVSVMSGRHSNRLLRDMFADALLEDQFIPIGIVSADLVTGDEYVHHRGLVREACRASSSLPGAWPPVIDGERVLVDGGVVNNLPIDVTRRHCQNGKVIAVDICGRDDYSNLEPYGTELSGWKVLARRFVRTLNRGALPSMMETILRCCMLTNANRIKSLQTGPQLLLLQPPITHYDIFEIRTASLIKEVEAKCYEYTLQALNDWKSELV